MPDTQSWARLNVFVPPERFAEVVEPLERLGVAADNPSAVALIRATGRFACDVCWAESYRSAAIMTNSGSSPARAATA